MEENKDKFVGYVDTSYLTYMPAAEKADWNRLLEHAKSCIADLNAKPLLEIHISEIALREYRGKMIDELLARIEQTKTKMSALQAEWQKNDIAKELDYPFPRDRDIFPQKDEIISEADRFIGKLLDSGVKQINMQGHHKDAVWENYFNWDPPFNTSSISERGDKKVREKRRTHIPDAWILEAAIDAKNIGHKMLCLCGDGNLSAVLEAHNHRVFKVAKDVLDVLFPPEPTDPTLTVSDGAETEVYDQTPLDSLLSKTPNDNIKNIYLRLLGFVVPLNTPTHDSLIDAVASKGFDRKLTEACAVILSDKSKPYIKDTGSHYIVWNKEICTAAADRLTQEIIDMLE